MLREPRTSWCDGLFTRDRWVRCDLRFPGRCSRDVRLHGVLLRKLLGLRRSQQCVLFDVVAIYGGSSAGVGDGRCRVSRLAPLRCAVG